MRLRMQAKRNRINGVKGESYGNIDKQLKIYTNGNILTTVCEERGREREKRDSNTNSTATRLGYIRYTPEQHYFLFRYVTFIFSAFCVAYFLLYLHFYYISIFHMLYLQAFSL